MVNKPKEVKDCPTLPEVCKDVACVLLHTSDKFDSFVLKKDTDGKIIKVESSPDDDQTELENSIKFSRLFRKTQVIFCL